MKTVAALLMFCICSLQSATAQLCTGSLGDPLVNITFGNTSTPLPYGITSLRYKSGDCPDDGYYTITNKTSFCFGTTWHTMSGDHTGDKNGQFMLINASFSPDDFYIDTVRGLCANTTFEFSAWVANMLRLGSCGVNGNEPNLTFRIEATDGTILTTYNTGTIPSNSFLHWNHYGTFFKTPAGSDKVVLRIRNNAPGGCGNDLAMDDITFRPCGPLVTASVRGTQETSFEFCANQPRSFVFDVSSSNGFNGSILQWQVSSDSGATWTDIAGAGSVSMSVNPADPGVLKYRVVVAEAGSFASVQCRVASNIITIRVDAVPKYTGSAILNACLGKDIQLPATLEDGDSYLWTGPNGFSSQMYNPIIRSASYLDSGPYKLLVVTPLRCRDSSSFTLHVNPGVTASVSANVSICEGSSTTLIAGGGAFYRWSPATGLRTTNTASVVASPPDTTAYRVVVSNSYSCTDTGYVTVSVVHNPIVSAGPDKYVFEGGSVQLEGSITGKVSGFYWLPNSFIANTGSLTPTVTPADSITYTLYALPGMQCPVVSDAVFVRVYRKLFIPNVFSPNGDGINDIWIIKGIETYPDAITRVFNRMGRIVFETRSAQRRWDGTFNGSPVPVATYYYTVDPGIGGQVISGWVLVIR